MAYQQGLGGIGVPTYRFDLVSRPIITPTVERPYDVLSLFEPAPPHFERLTLPSEFDQELPSRPLGFP